MSGLFFLGTNCKPISVRAAAHAHPSARVGVGLVRNADTPGRGIRVVVYP